MLPITATDRFESIRFDCPFNFDFFNAGLAAYMIENMMEKKI